MVKLTEKQVVVLNYLKENGGRATVDEICEGTGFAKRSVNALITGMSCYEDKSGKGRTGKGVLDVEKNTNEDGEEVRMIFLTDAGMGWAPVEE